MQPRAIQKHTVAPLAGARIEIQWDLHTASPAVSLPSRERGLKFNRIIQVQKILSSLPSRERGLKFTESLVYYVPLIVAPLAGARIEIAYLGCSIDYLASLPSRERGLKSLI